MRGRGGCRGSLRDIFIRIGVKICGVARCVRDADSGVSRGLGKKVTSDNNLGLEVGLLDPLNCSAQLSICAMFCQISGMNQDVALWQFECRICWRVAMRIRYAHDSCSDHSEKGESIEL